MGRYDVCSFDQNRDLHRCHGEFHDRLVGTENGEFPRGQRPGLNVSLGPSAIEHWS
jgi:hypothetical protein